MRAERDSKEVAAERRGDVEEAEVTFTCWWSCSGLVPVMSAPQQSVCRVRQFNVCRGWQAAVWSITPHSLALQSMRSYTQRGGSAPPASLKPSLFLYLLTHCTTCQFKLVVCKTNLKGHEMINRKNRKDMFCHTKLFFSYLFLIFALTSQRYSDFNTFKPLISDLN